MSAKLMLGKDTAAAVKADLDLEIEELKSRGIEPRLDIIRVGRRPEDMAYENGARKRFEKLGLTLEVTELPEDVTEDDFEAALEGLNKDPLVHGILIFRPLPESLDVDRISRLTAPEKDVDCFDPVNIAKVLNGDSDGFAPCTAEAAIEIGERGGIDFDGKTVTIPLNELLEDSTEQAELTVSIAEFVYSTKDKACPGRWSKEVKIPVTYALKGMSYQFNSTTMVSFASEMAHPALREAFERSTLHLSDDGSFTINGSGRVSREPEDDDDTVEGSATAEFTITGKWDMKKDEGTATIRGTITHQETYNALKETTEVNHATDRDGIRLTLTSSDRTYRKEVTDFSYTFSGTGTVKAVNKELYKGIDGLILSLGTNWTRSGKYEHWRWTSYDRTGVPDNEIHTSTEPVLVKSEDHKDPWEEGWKICWTVGKHDPVLHVGTTTTMTLIPGK